METVTAFVPRDPVTCWRAFTDARHFVEWVPGLRRADILTKTRGLAEEVHYELADHAYTLVYTYDAGKREVRWQPKLGKAEGVAGFARFDEVPNGTQITYGVEHGAARGPAERGAASALVAAFVAFVQR